MQGTPASLQLQHAPNQAASPLCLGVQVELMVARWTNWPPIPPFGWQRGLAGMLLGALPHAFEGLLGYLIDYADGDGYYSSRRMQRFQQRHPGKHASRRGIGTKIQTRHWRQCAVTCAVAVSAAALQPWTQPYGRLGQLHFANCFLEGVEGTPARSPDSLRQCRFAVTAQMLTDRACLL